ncbi:NAD(P)-dependent oxidoreductase [Pseudomonas syringae]|uniref:SDR family oxidoreductase n=1 Tax=Pseudomonas syringae TaxID=317 RepID=A0A6B2AZC0_PSESX|nr:SDR family oxidoreductase [Pseudomonas syringae]MBI6561628.1 SDR family oxidoreductase [Pseudomonas syringae]MBI6571680.1 SDR family oxidoreductase [Pseudomonas syringae]MBI6587005.1 SDR family oxidoreductase [Pseudomonas syringae]MBI6595495.1 SDR family oxidoreductase [Pseudomonas syringae]MDC6488421.1 SDR family oxidoreductase [Pseudomonas syringae]
MIVVTGATGQLGRLVIEQLLSRVPASQIIAAVRSPEKTADLSRQGIQVRQADYSQPATLDSAFAGADKVLLISSSEVGQRLPQHKAVIDAAKRAGVQLLAYTSVLHADTSALSLAKEHRETEDYLRANGLPFALLRNGWYTENYTAGIPGALAHGAVMGCADEGRISSASRLDYAEAAAVLLTSKTAQAGNVYELAGDESYTLSEFAAQLSTQSGKSLPYVNLPQAEFEAALIQAGLPDFVARLLADSDAAAAKDALFDDSRQLSALIGRPTTLLSVTIAETLKG